MSWNYRVIKLIDETIITYGIHEVYYDDEGEPESYTSEPIRLSAETFVELSLVLARILDALKKPVLSPDDFGVKP